MTSEKSRPPKAASDPDAERLHKFLASTGAGSRRECEELIRQGRVSVNGKQVTKMGVKVVPGKDAVTLDGEKVRPQRKVYFLLNKPPGYICTNSDERRRPRAMDLVPDQRQRIYTVGRLDADSRGLILLTNDGTIANIICHPRYRVEKVYEVSVRGRVTRDHVTKLEAGVWLAEGRASPAHVHPQEFDSKRQETRLAMTLFEGRNREIRRVFAKVGLKVRRLRRTRIGPLRLEGLAEGACRVLAPADLRFVYEAERLYQANREMWDAGLPPEPPRRKPRPLGPSRPGAQRAPERVRPPRREREGGGGRKERPARGPRSPESPGRPQPPRRRRYYP